MQVPRILYLKTFSALLFSKLYVLSKFTEIPRILYLKTFSALLFSKLYVLSKFTEMKFYASTSIHVSRMLTYSTNMYLFCFQISDKSNHDSADYKPVSGELMDTKHCKYFLVLSKICVA